MGAVNTNLTKVWDDAFKTNKLDKSGIEALKTEVLADNKIDAEEISFLESKVSELTDITEKAELSKLVQDLKSSSSEIAPNQFSFSEKQIEKLDSAQKNIVKLSKQIDQLLKSGKPDDAEKAVALCKKMIDNMNVLQSILKGDEYKEQRSELKKSIIAAKLNLAAAEFISGDTDGTAKVLSLDGKKDSKYSFSDSDLKFISGKSKVAQGLKQQYDRIAEPTQKTIEHVKEVEKNIKSLQDSVQGLQTLIKENKTGEAIPKAKAIISELEAKYPDNKDMIAGLKLQLASLYMATGKTGDALKELKDVKSKSGDDGIKDRATLLESQIHIKNNNMTHAMKNLNSLLKSKDPEIASAAKEMKVSIEISYLDGVKKMADYNEKTLNQIKEDKTPQSGWALANPLTSVKLIAGHYDNIQTIHDHNISELGEISSSAALLQNAMKKSGKSLSEIGDMSFQELKTILTGLSPATHLEIKRLINNNPDVKKISSGALGNDFSWDKNKLYKDADYLDTEFDIAAKWIGNQVKGAREFDEVLMRSDSRLDRIIGYSSAFILDSVSDANHFVKDSIKNAHEYYNADDKKGSVLAWVGDKLTTGGDILASTVTAPATLVDHKATDAERSEALTTTALIIGTMGVIKAGAPAWKSMGAGAASIGAGASVVLPKVGQTIVNITPKVIKAPIGSVVESKFVQGVVQKGGALVDDIGAATSKTKDFLTKERHIGKKFDDVGELSTVEVGEASKSTFRKAKDAIRDKLHDTPVIGKFVNSSDEAAKIAEKKAGELSTGQKVVNKTRDVLHDTPVIGKFVQSTDEIAAATKAVGGKIEKGFTDLMSRNAKALEAKGFTVPKTMDEFNTLVATDPMKAKQMITTSLLEEASVKKGLDKIVQEAKKGLSPDKLSKFDPDKAIQQYMLKNPEKFYDEFGGMLTEHFAKGLSEMELKKAGLEFFSHYTNKGSMSKILSSGKILEQKWDVMSGPIANLTDDIMSGKLLNPLKIKERLQTILTETRTWGFRGSKPLGLKDINTMDKTVASLNTSKSPEAVINVLVPKSKLGSPKDWKRINDIMPGTKSLGTMRGGVELFPKELSESIMTKTDRATLIKGITYQGTVAPEIVNAIAGALGISATALGAQVEWGFVLDILQQQIDEATPQKK
jgi:hypothetical protein